MTGKTNRLKIFSIMTTTTRRKPRKKYDGPTAEEKLCSALVELMEQGKNPWRKEWKQGAASGGHRNLITGKPYRGSNPILLEMYQCLKGHSLPLWCGAGQAKQKGWWPVKGSKAAYILRPQLNKFTDEMENVETGKAEEVTRQWMSYKPAAVFNVADLKGKDEASQKTLDVAVLAASGSVVLAPEMERLEAAETALGQWEVDTKWAGDRAFYSVGADTITMPERHLWESQSGLYAVWAHECIHSTGAEKRLKRTFGGHGSKAYAREELVAELGAFLVCNRLQISSDAQNHAAYLSHWAEILKEGPKVLFKVLSDATKASNLILGAEVTED